MNIFFDFLVIVRNIIVKNYKLALSRYFMQKKKRKVKTQYLPTKFNAKNVIVNRLKQNKL